MRKEPLWMQKGAKQGPKPERSSLFRGRGEADAEDFRVGKQPREGNVTLARDTVRLRAQGPWAGDLWSLRRPLQHSPASCRGRSLSADIYSPRDAGHTGELGLTQPSRTCERVMFFFFPPSTNWLFAAKNKILFWWHTFPVRMRHTQPVETTQIKRRKILLIPLGTHFWVHWIVAIFPGAMPEVDLRNGALEQYTKKGNQHSDIKSSTI